MRLGKFRIGVVAGLTTPVVLVAAAALHPLRSLRLTLLAFFALGVGWLALLLSRRVKRPVSRAGVDWVALAAVGLSIWWVFFSARLLLPFPFQILCRIHAISLGVVAAVVLHRALPRPLHRLGLLFPLVPAALSLLIPLGPVRWDLGALEPDELTFVEERMLVRARGGTVLVYDFPHDVPMAAAGFAPYHLYELPSFGALLSRHAPTGGWQVNLAALESERTVGIGAVPDRSIGQRPFHHVQTDSELLAVTGGAKEGFLAVYRAPDHRVYARLMDADWEGVSAPILLPGWGLGLTLSANETLLAYLDGDNGDRGVWVVDVTSGQKTHIDLSREIAAAGGGDRSYFYSLAFSPDGKELALGLSWKGGGDCPGLVWQVNLEGEVRGRYLTPTPGELRQEPFISILRYAPDGKRLVSEVCCFPSRLTVIDLGSGRVRNLPLGNRGFDDAAFSPDDRYLVATRFDGIYLWKVGR